MVKITDLYFSILTIFNKFDKIEIIFHKNFSKTSQNLENSKINLLDFHTIWPEISKNYGYLFFKIQTISTKFNKLPENSGKLFSKTSQILSNLIKSKSFFTKTSQNYFQNSKNF